MSSSLTRGFAGGGVAFLVAAVAAGTLPAPWSTIVGVWVFLAVFTWLARSVE